MKPRMKFYNDGSRVVKGNMIIPYELLAYVIQLKKGKNPHEGCITIPPRYKINNDVMISHGVVNPNTGLTMYIKAL